MAIRRAGSFSPAVSAFVAWAEFLDQTGTPAERVRELIELGWLKPSGQSAHALLFRTSDIYRTRKLMRICDDFELPSLAGTIIVDLLDRIDDLETRLRELER
ncbi:chaperone modulator CbpM [uncultured Mailhella sp.]|uniref:chaperone modulator CbpM n=1 Tax=uncultured Mailhella sp. TaxID=1981031 RepID=UPI00262D9FE4|nr:chaperone modulator CbpM [uncultured Mailhella sp.]